MTSTSRYDAVVIGGGVAGSTAAILLADAGWSVAVVEKARLPRRKVCGECVAATNFPLLDALGVGAAFAAAAGPPLERVGLYAGDQELTAENKVLGSVTPGRDSINRVLGRRPRQS